MKTSSGPPSPHPEATFEFDKIATTLRNVFPKCSARQHRHIERCPPPKGRGHRCVNFADGGDPNMDHDDADNDTMGAMWV